MSFPANNSIESLERSEVVKGTCIARLLKLVIAVELFLVQGNEVEGF
jgi:hypothetical protein